MTKPLKYTTEGVPKNWDEKDWPTYKWAMNTVFREKKLTDIVKGTITRSMLSRAESEEEFDHNQMKILRLVGTSVPPEILHQIRDKTTGTEMWRALCDLFEGRTNKAVMAHRIRSLRNEIWNTKLSPGGDANKHLSKMFNLRTELASLQYTVEDTDMVEMLLESLPNQPEFENMKSAIRYNPDFGVFTPNNVRDMIRAADSRQREFRSKESGGHRGSQRHGGNSGGAKEKDTGTKGSRQMQDVSKDSSKQKKQKKCYICESTEHLRSDCPERTKIQPASGANANEQKRKHRGNVTIRQISDQSQRPQHEHVVGGVVTGALEEAMVNAEVEANEEDHADTQQEITPGEMNGENNDLNDTSGGWWYFDTASEVHVTGQRSYYVAFTEDSSQSQSVHGVTAAMAARIAGVGTVALVTEVDGERVVFYLNDVFYIPGANEGLFSPGLAAEQGLEFDYDQETMNFTVLEEGRTVFVATPQGTTWGFPVTGWPCSPSSH